MKVDVFHHVHYHVHDHLAILLHLFLLSALRLFRGDYDNKLIPDCNQEFSVLAQRVGYTFHSE